MNRISAFLTRFFKWVAEPKLAWVGLLVSLFLCCFALRDAATESSVRIAGLLFQWLGIGTVAYGVRKTRQLFDEPSFWEIFVAWLARRPRWRRDAIVGAGLAELTAMLGKAHGEVWTNVQPDDPADVKIAALVRNVDRLREGLRAVRKQIDVLNDEHSTALKAEERARAAADAKLDAQLKEAQTGGLHITFLGAIWLFLGVLFGSIPSEIYHWRH